MTTFAPRHCDIWPWTKWVAAELTTPIRVNDSGFLGMGYVREFGGTAVIDQSISYDVALDAGTWTLTVIGRTGNNHGIATCYLDATSLGTMDWYSAGSTPNVVKQIAGFTVATAGTYRLKLKMEGKNASSSSYSYWYVLITLTRTGA